MSFQKNFGMKIEIGFRPKNRPTNVKLVKDDVKVAGLKIYFWVSWEFLGYFGRLGGTGRVWPH